MQFTKGVNVMRKIEVEMLVWTNKVEAFEMEEMLEFTGLSVSDILEDNGINYKWKKVLFDESTSFVQAVKETVKKIYDENKSYKFLEAGIHYVNI